MRFMGRSSHTDSDSHLQECFSVWYTTWMSLLDVTNHLDTTSTAAAGPMSDHALMGPHAPYIQFHVMSSVYGHTRPWKHA